MAIHGLWARLSAAEQRIPFQLLQTAEPFSSFQSKRTPCLAIDASAWLFHSTAAQGGSDPVLRTLFFRLCRLTALGCTAIFVFDGPYRPHFKRIRNPNKAHKQERSPPNLEITSILNLSSLDDTSKAFAELVQAFGFQWMVALGEAEAECAHLVVLGLSDAVLSDDNDALVFGAPVLIRNWLSDVNSKVSKKPPNSTSNYEAARIFTPEALMNQLGLNQTRLQLMALLCESDYGKGLPGFGATIAFELLTSADFAERFALILETHGQSKPLASLEQQQAALEELIPLFEEMNATLHRKKSKKSKKEVDLDITEKPLPMLSRSYPSLSIPTDGSFPNWQTLNAYYFPLVYDNSLLLDHALQHNWSLVSLPNIRWLKSYCTNYLKWSASLWRRRLHRSVLPAVRQRFFRIGSLSEFKEGVMKSDLQQPLVLRVLRKRKRRNLEELEVLWNQEATIWSQWFNECVPDTDQQWADDVWQNEPDSEAEDSITEESEEQSFQETFEGEASSGSFEVEGADEELKSLFGSETDSDCEIFSEPVPRTPHKLTHSVDITRTPPPPSSPLRCPGAPRKYMQPIRPVGMLGPLPRQPRFQDGPVSPASSAVITEWVPSPLLGTFYPLLTQQPLKRRRRALMQAGQDPRQLKLDAFWTKKAKTRPQPRSSVNKR